LYGVLLNFTPTVLSPDRINIRVSPEVSELDYTNSVTTNGFNVPGLSVRRATTTVELGDGQSFAIAGLLLNNSRENISKFPVLGNIPILGVLFRSSSFQKNETELVIVVTPRFVKPSNQKKLPLPTDNYIEPTFMDLAFPEFSSMVNKEGAASAKGTLDGEFGAAAPKS
jgi:pilus assembly protein CpaC